MPLTKIWMSPDDHFSGVDTLRSKPVNSSHQVSKHLPAYAASLFYSAVLLDQSFRCLSAENVMKSMRQSLEDIRWVALDGTWEPQANELCFSGYEYDPPEQTEASPINQDLQATARPKYVGYGRLLFGTKFQEGRIGITVEFDEVDHRSMAGIILQCNPENGDMITFVVTGGSLIPKPGVAGYMFKLQSWGKIADLNTRNQSLITEQTKTWNTLFQTGIGTNIRSRQPYRLEILVRGGVISLYVDEVEIGRYNLEASSLVGRPCGLLTLAQNQVHFRDVHIETTLPRAFIVMEFHTAEYEALFKEVIEPICRTEGLEAFRADFTYLPGPIVDDIKRQIRESRVVIAEITPNNPNVYYEVGYADALNKPIILISNRKDGLKPFDVRSYRTLFYDDSIGGKRQVEDDLRAYLQATMTA